MTQNRTPIDTSVFDVITLIPTNPNAGEDLSFVIPTNRRIMPISIQMLITFDANVISRRVGLVFHDGITAFIEVEAANGEVASTAKTYYWIAGIGGLYSSTGLSNRINSLPIDQWLDDRAAIQTNIQNIQAGDQISNIFIRAHAQIVE